MALQNSIELLFVIECQTRWLECSQMPGCKGLQIGVPETVSTGLLARSLPTACLDSSVPPFLTSLEATNRSPPADTLRGTCRTLHLENEGALCRLVLRFPLYLIPDLTMWLSRILGVLAHRSFATRGLDVRGQVLAETKQGPVGGHISFTNSGKNAHLILHSENMLWGVEKARLHALAFV